LISRKPVRTFLSRQWIRIFILIAETERNDGKLRFVNEEDM